LVFKAPDGRACNVLDVTFRDGGFAIGFDWPASTIRRTVPALGRAGIDVVEVGYVGGIPELHGIQTGGLSTNVPLRLCKELSAQNPIAVMVHPSAHTEWDFDEIAASGVSLVRVVYHHDWHDRAFEVCAGLRRSGVRFSLNLALASRYSIEQLRYLVGQLAPVGPDILYIADTCSALRPDETYSLISAAGEELGSACATGFHAHDFMSLALANSLAAQAAGATWIDSSLCGVGRGLGNLRSELLAAFASRTGGMTIEPMLDALAEIERLSGRRSAVDICLAAASANLVPPEEDELRRVSQELGLDEARAAALFLDRRLWEQLRASKPFKEAFLSAAQ
jgi:isopropylmalate/homocitrate/citramalate synthase